MHLLRPEWRGFKRWRPLLKAARQVPLSVFAIAACFGLGSGRGSAQALPGPAVLTLGDDGLDANGFLLNPTWQGQAKEPGKLDVARLCGFVAGPGAPRVRELLLRKASCTTQIDLMTLNEPWETKWFGYACNQSSGAGQLSGHVNWFPVTMTGRLWWTSYESGDGDHDYTLHLKTAPPRRPHERQ